MGRTEIAQWFNHIQTRRMIAENLQNIKAKLPANVTLAAVSKTKPNEDILEAYQAGQRIFGENKVQELTQKYEALPKDIQWHMIGHLQTNKVKYIVPFVSLIHGVHKFKLLKTINSEAEKVDRVVNVLLQFHIAEEDTKFGFSIEEVQEMLGWVEFHKLKNIDICGVMGMATHTDDTEKIRDEFRTLNNYFELLKSQFFKYSASFNIISMGMSGDYPIAIEEGSNMVRIGSAIFGKRNYNI